MIRKPQRPWQRALQLGLFLMLSVGGCAGKSTFAGFTFGGGGHTHSAEPASITFGKPSKLVAGTPQSPVYIDLEWESDKSDFKGEKIPLSKIRVKVDGEGESENLVEGQIVLQAGEQQIGHGSFQATVKLEDGREFPVVGSFTASIP